MLKDGQVRRLREILNRGEGLCRAALKVGMDRKSAGKYQAGKMPSERAGSHDWRTREDPFAEVWPEVEEQLSSNARLQAKTLFAWLQQKHPGKYCEGQLRTFQRGVKRWRALHGEGKQVYFEQVHRAGELCSSDFTNMNDLKVTIAGHPLEHLVYHFVLTYSNWEWATICGAESFESLSEGLQESLWRLEGVPRRHRSDRLSAAVNNLSDRRQFTHRYQALLDHYGLSGEKTNAGCAHENGDVESLHRHLKEAIDQGLQLRGSREFANREAYAGFLGELMNQRNAGRRSRLEEEREQLKPLPCRRLESHRRLSARVNRGSLIRVQGNVYSVHSRLIGAQVEVRVFADHVEVWYAQKLVERAERLRGRQKHAVNYRHLIDWLVRKPGAFANYRYREDMFPTSRFRMAYDSLCAQSGAAKASREYLSILEMAARENESLVDEALRHLIDSSSELTAAGVRQFVERGARIQSPTQVQVDPPDLGGFDSLLEFCLTQEQEVLDGVIQGCQIDAGWASA